MTLVKGDFLINIDKSRSSYGGREGSGGIRNGRNIEDQLIPKFVKVIPFQPILNQTNFDE